MTPVEAGERMTNGDFHCPACGEAMKGPTACGSCLWESDTCGYKSAVVLDDERVAFEAWITKEWPGLVIDRAELMGFYKGDDGARIGDMWDAWQARAASPQATAMQPCEVSWKEFRVQGDEKSIKEVRRVIYAADCLKEYESRIPPMWKNLKEGL